MSLSETLTAQTVMGRKVHIHHPMVGMTSLIVVVGYFFIFDEVLRFYVDLNRDAVFRLEVILRVSSVTCKVTG